jgi:hypothetical protein
MGTFSCCTRVSEDTSSIFAPGEQEISFPDYESRSDSYFALIEGKYNLIKNVQLLEFMNLLEAFSIETATINFQGKYRSNFSSKDEFLSTIIHQDEFQSFIENKLLNTDDIIEMYGEDEQTLALFKECFVKIFSSLNVKLNSIYKGGDKIDKISKRNIVGLGLLFCRGQNISKVKLFFDLFKDENERFGKSDILDNYLISLFIISSYCLLSIRMTINNPGKELPKIENNLAYNLLNSNGLAQKNCENLLKYFNDKFFEKENYTWDEFKKKFSENKKSSNLLSISFSLKDFRNQIINAFTKYNNS